MTTGSQNVTRGRFAELLKWHQRHIGLYARVAAKTGVSASYVSLIASGLRQNEEVSEALAEELEGLLRVAPK